VITVTDHISCCQTLFLCLCVTTTRLPGFVWFLRNSYTNYCNSFTLHPFPRKPTWTDLHQIWHIHSSHGHNQLKKIFGNRWRDVSCVEGQNFPFSTKMRRCWDHNIGISCSLSILWAVSLSTSPQHPLYQSSKHVRKPTSSHGPFNDPEVLTQQLIDFNTSIVHFTAMNIIITEVGNVTLIDWLSCGFTSHLTQHRSFRRRSPSQSLGLVWKN